jgi:hypothetical protein
MALTTNVATQSGGVCNVAIGNVVNDASVLVADPSFNCGFVPRYVKWQDRTNRISLEWYEGLAQNSAIRQVAAGTGTLDVAAGITVGTPAAGTGGTFTIKIADAPVSSAFSWMALG